MSSDSTKIDLSEDEGELNTVRDTHINPKDTSDNDHSLKTVPEGSLTPRATSDHEITLKTEVCENQSLRTASDEKTLVENNLTPQVGSDHGVSPNTIVIDQESPKPILDPKNVEETIVGTHSTTSTSVETSNRFRILRSHAKGGLGKVSVALDLQLNREVALKEILEHFEDDPTARERFVLEAEITGGLEHPGIVPVYALGQGQHGNPYYAMRFIKGDSLKRSIDDFHKKDKQKALSPGERQLALRQLLGRFTDVCNAMEYAHSRGVLHRDLKPANVMVGKYGETLVVDWGLAKAVGKAEVGADSPLRPTSALSGSIQTLQGSALGTPAYMSPEQAAGLLDNLGPATDIYSLGATLYHILCGRPPFERDNLTETLRKVRTGEFPRPRELRNDIPRGLEAICLKGMALRPEDRYSTANLMADDIEHWLADEPISAAQDTFSERLSRWARKNKGLVQAGSVSLALIALISSIAYGIVSLANHRLNNANKTISQQNEQITSKENKFIKFIHYL
ncbi:MAG: serine/threonine-protein kinase [Schlesneria sp.]